MKDTEKYRNLSDGSFRDDSSQTHLKREFTPDETVDASVISTSPKQTPRDRVTKPQPLPVRITNRTGHGSN